MKYRWKLHGHEVLFEKYFRLEEYHLSHELFGGGDSDVFARENFERGEVVAILPYDPVRRRVILIEQFRVGAIHREPRPWLIECVDGIVEEGEHEDEVAIRECREEAGCEVRLLHRVAQYYVSPGGTTETCTLYCGIVDSEGVGGIHGLAHENEDIRVEVIDAAKAFQWVREGVIKSSATIIALQWLELNQEAL